MTNIKYPTVEAASADGWLSVKEARHAVYAHSQSLDDVLERHVGSIVFGSEDRSVVVEISDTSGGRSFGYTFALTGQIWDGPPSKKTTFLPSSDFWFSQEPNRARSLGCAAPRFHRDQLIEALDRAAAWARETLSEVPA